MQTFAYRKEVLMSRFVTLKDVAERAGTTVGTVSYVLNNKKGRYISDELRQRVLLAASELNYIKCNGASSLKGMDRKLIGILIPQFENQFFTRICLAAEEVFVQHGYDLIICDTFDEPEREKAIIHRLLSQRVDGIIITPTVDGAENTKIARDVGMNMVVVDRPLEGLEGYHWVTTNNYGCGFEGGRYLRDCGHRKIIYIGWKSGIADLDSRETGLRDASAPDAEIYSYYAEFSPESGFAETEKALDDHPDAGCDDDRPAADLLRREELPDALRHNRSHGDQKNRRIQQRRPDRPFSKPVGVVREITFFRKEKCSQRDQ